MQNIGRTDKEYLDGGKDQSFYFALTLSTVDKTHTVVREGGRMETNMFTTNKTFIVLDETGGLGAVLPVAFLSLANQRKHAVNIVIVIIIIRVIIFIIVIMISLQWYYCSVCRRGRSVSGPGRLSSKSQFII